MEFFHPASIHFCARWEKISIWYATRYSSVNGPAASLRETSLNAWLACVFSTSRLRAATMVADPSSAAGETTAGIKSSDTEGAKIKDMIDLFGAVVDKEMQQQTGSELDDLHENSAATT